MWYYADGQEQRGPVSDQEVSALMQSRTVRPETLVWREGQAAWQPAIEVVPQHLRPDATGAPPPIPGDQPEAGPSKAPTAATEPYSQTEEGWDHRHPFNFQDSVAHVLVGNYFNFRGRARRREFWWFVLFTLMVSLVASLLGDAVNGIVTLALILPSLGVTARRLHDIGKSGWWQLVGLIPLIGLILMIYWTIQKSDPGPNEYGPV